MDLKKKKEMSSVPRKKVRPKINVAKYQEETVLMQTYPVFYNAFIDPRLQLVNKRFHDLHIDDFFDKENKLN